MWQLTLLTWTYWLAVIVALLGAAVLAWGWRARKLDDHPICRKCGYDLFGLRSDQQQCSECGANVSQPRAIYIGHRTRHKPMIFMGLLLAVLCIGGAYLADWRYTDVRQRPWHFIQAVQAGNLQEVNRLLNLHPQFAHGRYFGDTSSRHTPLQMAVRFARSQPIVQRLLQEKVDVNAPSDRGDTSLHMAVQVNNLPMAQLLLRHGADPNVPDNEGRTPLHWSARGHPQPAIAEALLQGGAVIGRADHAGRTPLHEAAIRSIDVVEVLLNAGAPVGARDHEGRTPLHDAIDRRNQNAARLLLDHGASLVAQDDAGLAPGQAPPGTLRPDHADYYHEITVTLWHEQLKAVKQADRLDEAARWLEQVPEVLTMDRGYSPATLLHIVVQEEGEALVALFLEHGADPNQHDVQSGVTALHTLTFFGHVGILKRLLDADAEVDAANDKGQTPLHLAAKYGKREMVRHLLDAGAGIEAQDQTGATPLQYAVLSDHFGKDKQGAVARLLIERGAVVGLHAAVAMGQQEQVERMLAEHPEQVNDQSNHFGRSPLHVAVMRGRVELAALLLEHGADPNLQDREGMTPPGQTALHGAAAWHGLEMVELLVTAGARVDVVDAHGRTPLHMAAHGKNLQVIECLLEHGAEINAVNSRGQTPLDVASRSKHQAVAELLKSRGARPGK